MKESETLKASFQILETGAECNNDNDKAIDCVHFEEYVNAVKRAQPKRTERWIEQTYYWIKESKGYEVISASDAISRIVPWMSDSYTLGSYKM